MIHMAHPLVKPSDAALERLAHATTNKSCSPASPLQALVRRRRYLERSVAEIKQPKGKCADTANPNDTDNAKAE
jgi:hypothetical protein